MNNASVAVPSACLKSVAEELAHRYSPVDEYHQRIQAARRELCNQLLNCFQALDQITEPEFLEIMKTANNGTDASDLLEKFRKWKGI